MKTIIAVAVALMLSGCAGGTKTTTQYSTDAYGTPRVESIFTESDTDFFTSGNLKMHYDAQKEIAGATERNVAAKTDALLSIAKTGAPTETEAAWKLAAITIALSAIKTDVPILPNRPETMGEIFKPSMPMLLGAGIGLMTGNYGFSGGAGGSSATGEGVAMSLNESDNNTFLITTRPSLTSSNFYPGLTSTNNRYTVLNTGEEAQTSALGSNTRDQSTETYTGDSALVPAP